MLPMTMMGGGKINREFANLLDFKNGGPAECGPVVIVEGWAVFALNNQQNTCTQIDVCVCVCGVSM